jgi:hypothetical protein
MSYDFATEKVCTHGVSFEVSEIDPFIRDTLRFQRPISSNKVKVYADGVEIPSSGLYSKGSITSTQIEPFRIKTGKNDLIYISIGQESPKLIQLISGASLSAKELAQSLKRQLPEIDIYAKNGRLSISGRNSGPGKAFTFHDPRWTDKTSSMPNTVRILKAYEEIGITPGRVAVGSLIFPGWKIVLDPNSLTGEDKVILFNDPIRNLQPVMQLSYTTNSANCRRCFGSKIEFDYSILNNTYETVENTDLLFQEFDKFLFTKAGSHWKWPWIGTKLTDRIGGKAATAFNTTQAFISMDVTQAFNAYKDIKTQQDRLVFQDVTDSEFPLSLDDLSVQYSTEDPTIAIVSTSISTRSREPVELKRIVGNPSPFYVAGNPDPFKLRG